MGSLSSGQLDCRVERVLGNSGRVIDCGVGGTLAAVQHCRIRVTSNFTRASLKVDFGVIHKGRGVCGKDGSDVNRFHWGSCVWLQGGLLYLVIDSLPEWKTHKNSLLMIPLTRSEHPENFKDSLTSLINCGGPAYTYNSKQIWRQDIRLSLWSSAMVQNITDHLKAFSSWRLRSEDVFGNK